MRINNTGPTAIDGWTVAWPFPNGQIISQLWNATFTQTGPSVSATNLSWNASIPAGGSVDFGFVASWNATNAAPTSFSVNGSACGASGGGSATATPTTTASATVTRTSTPIVGSTSTPTLTASATATRTSTPVPGSTSTATPTASPTATATRTPTLTPTGTGPTSTPIPGNGLVGWATVAGMGLGGTTGGAGGPTVTVTNTTDFIAALGRSGPLTIQVNGTLNFSGMQPVTSNKTIIGVGSAGAISGGGLDINNVQNVIVRNLTFSNASLNSMTVEVSAHHVWIDLFWSGTTTTTGPRISATCG